MSDAVDIINMSLGSFYGQPESADTQAVSNAVRAGVVVAVAAGNDGDRPWIVGQPSIAPAALAVAETALPDAVAPARPGRSARRSTACPATPSSTPCRRRGRRCRPPPITGVLTVPIGSGRPVGRARQPGLRRQQLRQLRRLRAPDRPRSTGAPATPS